MFVFLIGYTKFLFAMIYMYSNIIIPYQTFSLTMTYIVFQPCCLPSANETIQRMYPGLYKCECQVVLFLAAVVLQ